MRGCALVLMVSMSWGVAAVAEPGLAGRWSGEIEAADAVLHVELEIAGEEGEGLGGQIVIEEHGPQAKSLTDVSQQGLRVSFRILDMAGFPVFRGWIEAAGDVISGTLTQAGIEMPFRLERSLPPAERARSLLAGVDALVESARQDFRAPGIAVGVVLDGEVVLKAAFGTANVESAIPLASETRFAMGTATETLTTALLAAAVDDGRVAWDDPIGRVLPELVADAPDFWSDISLRDVVSHRTGVPSHVAAWYGDDDASRDEMASRLGHLPRSQPLRSAFAHQVIGAVVASRVVEKLYGSPWETVVADELLVPLGMVDTTLSGVDGSCARGYREREGEVRPVTGIRSAAAMPAVGAAASLGDLLTWVQAHLERYGAGGLLVAREATLHELMTPQVVVDGYPSDPDLLLEAFALGWFVESYRGHLHVHRSGEADGFTCQLSILPDHDIAVVVAVNVEGSRLPELLTRQLLDRLLELEYRDWLGQGMRRSAVVRGAVAEARRRQLEDRPGGEPPLRDLADYAGEYAHRGYGAFTVTDHGDRLLMARGGWRVGLVHWRDHLFVVDDDGTDILPQGTPIGFRVDAAGEVDSLVAPFEPAVAPLTLTRQPEARLRDPAYLDRVVGVYRAVGREIRVTRRGHRLSLVIGGGPPRGLVPRPGNVFALEDRPATRVRFVLAGDGPATDLRLDQPGGEFVAPRVADLG
jgi:CubicO group peptidase (beta-lactamase class C family)